MGEGLLTTGILTHVWRQDFQVDSGDRTFRIQPYYDRETGSLTYAVQRAEHIPEEDGEEGEVIVYALRTLSGDGGAADLPLPVDTGEWIGQGFMDGDGLTCLIESEDDSGNRREFLARYDFGTETWTRYGDTLPLYAVRPNWSMALAENADGTLSVASTDEILILSSEGELIRRIDPDMPRYQITELFTSEEGRIFAQFSSDSARGGVAEVFPEEGKIGGFSAVDGNIVGGTDGFLYYYSAQEGIFGRRETGEDVLLLDYASSGLTWSRMHPVYVSQDRIYIEDWDDLISDDMTLAGFSPADDIDLSEQQVITVAYFNYMMPNVLDAVNAFNREHPGYRAVMEDWGQYNNRDNPTGGYDRLLQNIVTGTYQPDIVLGGLEEPHLTALYGHGLTVDLTKYLKSDPVVNTDNLFGCVKRLFDNGEGGFWGIAPSFYINPTLISTPEFLGQYADKGYWTVADVLDYIGSLPEDTAFMSDLVREGVPLLEGGGYMEFVDRENDTCSFDSPAFIRYLTFADSLPAKNDWLRSSPYASGDAESLAQPRMNGQIRAVAVDRRMDANSLRALTRCFSTKDWTMIGYPAAAERKGAGVTVSSQFAAVITSCCQNPDLAWEIVRGCFASGDGQGGFPSLKSDFDATVTNWYTLWFADYYINHGDPDYAGFVIDREITMEDLRYPGLITTFEREERDKYIALLDEIGVTAEEAGNSAILSILREEMSSLFAGFGTAEDCAKKIQSRVSIWMAEHS